MMLASLSSALLCAALLAAGIFPRPVGARPGRPRNPHRADDRDCHARTLFPRLNPGAEHYLAEYDLTRLVPDALRDAEGNPCHTITAIEFELMDEGAITLARALHHNTDVHTIFLHYADVGDEGAEAIAELLRTNQALHTINLGHNAIENEGAEALAAALKVNHGLHTLTLDHNKIKEAGIRALIEALKINEDLLHMNVHSNHFNLQVSMCRANFSSTCAHVLLSNNLPPPTHPPSLPPHTNRFATTK